jgi:hypothetical protein
MRQLGSYYTFYGAMLLMGHGLPVLAKSLTVSPHIHFVGDLAVVFLDLLNRIGLIGLQLSRVVPGI